MIVEGYYWINDTGVPYIAYWGGTCWYLYGSEESAPLKQLNILYGPIEFDEEKCQR